MRGSLLAAALVALCAVWMASAAQAQVQPVYPEVPLTEAQEARYRALLPGLRCLQCQDESLADSQAPLAKDMRYKIQQLMAAGQSDAQIEQYLVDRYGQYVLFKPRFEPLTYLLWIGPFVLLVLGVGFAWWLLARRKKNEAVRFDREALKKLLGEEE
ncbi:MAG TPA: cytochrome c-type biogenesis protein [Nevskiaceae bacterium]